MTRSPHRLLVALVAFVALLAVPALGVSPVQAQESGEEASIEHQSDQHGEHEATHESDGREHHEHHGEHAEAHDKYHAGEHGEEGAEHHEHHQHHVEHHDAYHAEHGGDDDHGHHEHHGDHHEGHHADDSTHHHGSEHDMATVVEAYEADWGQVTGKLVDLARAIPADKYSWRPSEGVRSVSESLMHVAAANYMIASSLGAEMPADMGERLRTLEQDVTAKDEVLEVLEASIAFATAAVGDAPPGVASETVPVFGTELAGARVLLMLLGHSHEHLGQMIAYARSNDVVPPWSAGS